MSPPQSPHYLAFCRVHITFLSNCLIDLLNSKCDKTPKSETVCIAQCIRILSRLYSLSVTLGVYVKFSQDTSIEHEYRSQSPHSSSKTMSVYSKVLTPCVDYHCGVSCSEFLLGLSFASAKYAFQLYAVLQFTQYGLALLMRGRSPTKNDIKKTLSGILQSTAFLSFTGFGYSLFLCSLRKVLGHFNILTVSGVPVFLSSIFAILIERPSRRTLLSLYVSNVATETVWNMLVSRKMVKNIPNGSVAIFGASMALLLFFYKGGHGNQNDPIFKIIRFLLGPYESKDYAIKSSQSHGFYRENGNNERRRSDSWSSRERAKKKNFVLHILYKMLKVYKDLIYKIKGCDKHALCPHPHSCIYYTLQGATKMFSIGLGIQVALKLALNLPRIFKSPSSFKQIFLKKDILNLATFLGAYSGLFKGGFDCRPLCAY